MRRFLACLFLAVLAGPAAACINDVELPSHEREFRSRYLQRVDPPPPPTTEPAHPPGYRLLLGGGAALLTGAFALAVTGSRQRK